MIEELVARYAILLGGHICPFTVNKSSVRLTKRFDRSLGSGITALHGLRETRHASGTGSTSESDQVPDPLGDRRLRRQDWTGQERFVIPGLDGL